MTEAAFDIVAPSYDACFSNAWVGKEQRAITQQLLLPFLVSAKPLSILEVNCGTGIDAAWMASFGHAVVATDVSEAMISEATKNFHATPVEFKVCPFGELHNNFAEGSFDLIFSNFAGLNCLNRQELKNFLENASKLLRGGGMLAAVMFGKFCLWETLYFMLKAKPSKAIRRWQSGPVQATLDESHRVPVYYHRSPDMEQSKNLKLVLKRPVGLFIPPSYLDGYFYSRPSWRSFLSRMERRASFSALSSFADHSFYLLKKTV